jgi:hypothetical protein
METKTEQPKREEQGTAALLRTTGSTIARLIERAKPARGDEKSGFSVRTEVLYQNDDTGSVVLKAVTDNSEFRHRNGFGKPMVWTYFLAGNNDGCTTSESYINSGGDFGISKVAEDSAVITLNCTDRVKAHFGLSDGDGNITFEKAKFTPYRLPSDQTTTIPNQTC